MLIWRCALLCFVLIFNVWNGCGADFYLIFVGGMFVPEINVSLLVYYLNFN